MMVTTDRNSGYPTVGRSSNRNMKTVGRCLSTGKSIVIPAEVNYRNITAEYNKGLISIKLPFNELADGYHQDIDLEMN